MPDKDKKKKKKHGGGSPGNADDYLYVIVQGQYYRLAPADVRVNPPIERKGNDKDVFDAIEDLQEKNSVVADLPGADGAGKQDSCICVVLNIDVFDAKLRAKKRRHAH